MCNWYLSIAVVVLLILIVVGGEIYITLNNQFKELDKIVDGGNVIIPLKNGDISFDGNDDAV